MKIPLPTHQRRPSGFSLAETAISVAITAMGITSILGLLPHGMDTMRKAGNVATEARIVQQIVGTVAQSRWQDDNGDDVLVKSYDKVRFLYDDLAVQLDAKNSGLMQSYVAEVGIAPADIALPGSSASGTAGDPYLRRVTVKIANAPADGFDFANAKPVTYHTYASVVTRSGK